MLDSYPKSLQNLRIGQHVHSSQLKSTRKPDEPIFATTDATCYSTGYDPQTRTCPAHGYEELRFYAGGWNRHEAVFHVNGVYYAVKVAKDTDPFQIIKAIVTSPGNYQAWRYGVGDVWYTCTDPGPYPQPLPQQ